MTRELTRTSIFPDPLKNSRFIRGVLFGKNDQKVIEYTRMEVWFYHKKHDKEPYWKVPYGLHGPDDTFVAYHRRPLFHGLKNNIMRKYFAD